MSDEAVPVLPALAAGDVYLYAHGNGAIFVVHGDGRSLQVTLADASATARGAHERGHRVVVGGDDAPLALDVLTRLGALGVALEPFASPAAPTRWHEGTDALFEAAANGADHLLDDLIDRGADVHHRDDSGSTALHHAAANGSTHAIDALVAAGARLEATNHRGSTPLMLARACRQPEAAARLEALGAASDAGPPEPIRFRRSHLGTVYVWIVPLLLVVGLLVGFSSSGPVGPLAAAAFLAVYALVVPPLAFWAGGAPHTLAGTTLTLRRPHGPLRSVDLTQVSLAAMGGSTSTGAFMSARWLLLAHPEGAPVTRRSLRRLLVPADELDDLAARMDRVVVVPLDGANAAEAVVPIGTLLAGRGVDLSGSLRRQLARRPGSA